ncbi:MAG: DUF4355 domain-containing protein [Actinomycetaceae bacterium]|nr:DUF4355 domain-containing protein [Actinomycetaceae bacterium]MDY6082580.1 DUF4355 domain-containing protein [Actinomycetaceae bacterium]
MSDTTQQVQAEPQEPAQATSTPTQETTFEPITSQEQLDRLIQSRLSREKAKYADYADLKAKATKWDEIEQANKTELQKAQDALKVEREARTSAEVSLLRYQVAAEQGLDAKAAAFLQGSTREEMEASASQLSELMGGSRQTNTPNPLAGREEKPESGSGDWLRDSFNRRN